MSLPLDMQFLLYPYVPVIPLAFPPDASWNQELWHVQAFWKCRRSGHLLISNYRCIIIVIMVNVLRPIDKQREMLKAEL